MDSAVKFSVVASCAAAKTRLVSGQRTTKWWRIAFDQMVPCTLEKILRWWLSDVNR
jgi:hypothetical protein